MLRLFLLILSLTVPLHAANIIDIRPGTHSTPLQDTINSLPKSGTYTVIRLAPGTYREKIHVPRETPPFKLLGSAEGKSRIVWSDNAETPDKQGHPIGTFRSSSVTIESDDFTAENITFENDHGPGVQAVALSIGGDRGVFRNCAFLGWQDTLLVRKKRQYFDQCRIVGSVDFIFGDATAFFDHCTIEVLDKGFITAASTAKESRFGFVFSHCKISAPGGKPFFLGRPWGPHSSVHFLNCEMPGEVRPEGWDNWRDPEKERTARYYEWRSSGPGSKSEERVKWSHQLDATTGKSLSRASTIFSGWDPKERENLEISSPSPP